jgi:hypothetical protein
MPGDQDSRYDREAIEIRSYHLTKMHMNVKRDISDPPLPAVGTTSFYSFCALCGFLWPALNATGSLARDR